MQAKPKKRTQAERRDGSEQRMIQAGLKLIEKKGYGNFSLSELGLKAGYSRGLASHHFGKKADLLNVILERIAKRYSDAMLSVGDQIRGLPRLIAMIRLYSEAATGGDGRILSILFGESVFDRRVRSMVTFINEGGLRLVRNEIELGKAVGNVIPDVDSDLYAQVVYSFLRGHMNLAVTFEKYDGEAALERFIQIISHQIGTVLNDDLDKKVG